MVSIIYPPPSGKDIVYFEFCMNLQRIFVLLASGNLCIYSFMREENKVEGDPFMIKTLGNSG